MRPIIYKYIVGQGKVQNRRKITVSLEKKTEKWYKIAKLRRSVGLGYKKQLTGKKTRHF